MQSNKKKILLAHGSGGSLSRRLIEDVFLDAFRNPLLSPLNDQAIFNTNAGRLAFTTDSYVVSPIFFPGGDIGRLSICGTVNDLAMGGADPLYMSAAFIIEEGFGMDELRRVVQSMSETARECGVSIVTGDTKVVQKGKGDSIFINTAGIGVVCGEAELGPSKIRPTDVIIVSGMMGDHGIAILTKREGIELDVPVESDCAPLHTLTKEMLSVNCGIRAMRDPTRGGLATILNEFAASSGTAMIIDETMIPVREEVRGACEILGFDPLYLANEGKLVAVVDRDAADKVLGVMKKHRYGADAAIIGTVAAAPKGKVLLKTSIGSTRILDMLSGEQLPRIC